MDIPNSGAIFTLGKSHLAENTQSYFYIRNDPIRRLIAGPHQSAVICESGRLFAWGENAHGQLGIGQQPNHNNKNNNESERNSKANHEHIVTKPTCVKSFKNLGLKVVDIAFGNDWSIIITHSNELFFSGRNIFPNGSDISSNFTLTTVADEECEIIRKPFRVEELDNCLTKNENGEHYTAVLAGNDHFVLMTSLGRLIAWGSNQSYQIGLSNEAKLEKPHEINLDASVQQFVCGPESTLVLTNSGKLYLTGILNEFVFSQFTELQQNLAPMEQIIFMHISKTNEIYIVTNTGSIYRSMESLRTKTLIFQRFYDYDSEENGPIWKLLKGFSFYTVLTKANKFYTTFSESGHHLKTFREISKFKNLRLLDVAVGNQHILVHGIPRSSTISANVGYSNEPHRFASRTFVMPANVINGSADKSRSRGHSATRTGNKGRETSEKESVKLADLNKNVLVDDMKEITPNTEAEKLKIQVNYEQIKDDTTRVQTETQLRKSGSGSTKGKVPPQSEESIVETRGKDINSNDDKSEAKHVLTAIAGVIHNEAKSPTVSNKSKKSVKLSPTAINGKQSPATDKQLRPHTPYPESNTTASTPPTIKKTPLRNYSYEAAMDHDHIDRTSPELIDNLENIPECKETKRENEVVHKALVSSYELPFEEDEHLAVEINTTTDPLNSTVVVNEIRFINNGIDVTDNVKEASFDMDDSESTIDSSEEQIEDSGRNTVNGEIKKGFEKIGSEVNRFAQAQAKNASEIASGIKPELSTEATNISKSVSEDLANLKSDLKSHKEELTKTCKMENTSKKVTSAVHTFEGSVKKETKNELYKQSEHISETASDIKNDLYTNANKLKKDFAEIERDSSKKAISIREGIADLKNDLKLQTDDTINALSNNLESTSKKVCTTAADLRNAVKSDMEDRLDSASKYNASSEINDNLSPKAKNIRGVTNVKAHLKSQTEETKNALVNNLENATNTAFTTAAALRDSVETDIKNRIDSTSKYINETSSEINYHLPTKKIGKGVTEGKEKDITKNRGVTDVKAQSKSQSEETKNALTNNLENATNTSFTTAADLRDSMETDIKNRIDSTSKYINETSSEINDHLPTKKIGKGVKEGKEKDITKNIDENVTKVQTDLRSNIDEANDTLTSKLESAAQKAFVASADMRDYVDAAAKRGAAGAREAVETVEGNAKQVANDTKNAVESIGSSAKKVATEAKNAVGNVFIKMSDGTKDAVDSVAAKIANEVQGAKENINTIFHGKSSKSTPTEDDAVSAASEAASKDGGPKTNTTIGEDDERTTASVNSTQNSTGNPFEAHNPFDGTNTFSDGFDDIVERGKKAFRDEINNSHQQRAPGTPLPADTKKEQGMLRQFFSDIRGISCRNEKSVAVADEPPRYSLEDRYPSQIQRDDQNNTSKVCSIL